MSFFGAVISGIAAFAYWEIYVAILEYAAIWLIPLLAFGFFAEKKAETLVAGCSGIIVLSTLQITAIFVFVVTIGPIILGFSEDAAWMLPWQILVSTPFTFLKTVGFLFIVMLVLSIIPFIGNLHSLHILILSILTLTLMLEFVSPNVGINYTPTIGFVLGILILGGTINYLGVFLLSLILHDFDEGSNFLIVQPILGLLGFIPTFMYGAWLGAQFP